MRIALLCATRRGNLCLRRLKELRPGDDLVVFSFPEDPWEPPFLEDIRALTVASGGQFFEARQVGSPRWGEFWASTPIDLMLAVNWRYLIPASVYLRPRLGTLVFHDSLLPKYRGFSPTVWAIINGEAQTGVTLFAISEGVDEGDIVDQETVAIGPDDPIALVMERVTVAYLVLLERNLESLLKGAAPRRPQDHSQATYTCKRLPGDNCIDWTAPSEAIHNLIRAVSAPYPGAHTYLSGQRMYVWAARRLPSFPPYVGRVSGRVVEVRPGEGSVVLAGDGAILLTQVQVENGGIVPAVEVLNSLAQTLGR